MRILLFLDDVENMLRIRKICVLYFCGIPHRESPLAAIARPRNAMNNLKRRAFARESKVFASVSTVVARLFQRLSLLKTKAGMWRMISMIGSQNFGA